MKHKFHFSALLLVWIIPAGLMSQTVLERSVYFDTDKYIVTKRYADSLEVLYNSVQDVDITSVSLEGHTDATGEASYNLQLSKNRAMSVFRELVKVGIPAEIITSVGKGEDYPVADNETVRGRSLNRRVDILIHLEEKPQETQTAEEDTSSPELYKLYELLETPPERFYIAADKDTVVITENGTILYISKNTFAIPNNSELLELSVKDIRKKSEIIRNDLTTVTNRNDIMISQAMLYIGVTYKGELLEPDIPITVLSPADTLIEEMQVFDGYHSPDDYLHWMMPGEMADITGVGFWSGSTKRITRCPFFFCGFLRWFGINRPKVEFVTDDEELQRFERKYRNVDIDKLKDIPREDMEYYVFNSNTGWTNLDWLFKVENPVQYAVAVKPDRNTDIRLVFRNQRSVVPLLAAEDRYYYDGLPLGEEIFIVGLRYRHGIPYLAIEEDVVRAEVRQDLDFKQYPVKEIIEKLRILDQPENTY